MAKRRFGDRKDGALVRDLDPMHFITPLLYPNRCDNEAYLSVRVDLEQINRYVAALNESDPDFRYTMFHVIVAAVIKTVTLRPKMNRFIANKNMYQRNGVSASFVVKKQFSDKAEEGLAFIRAKPESTFFTIMEDLKRQITTVKKEGAVDASSDAMDLFNKMPRFLSKFIVWVITRLDVHGKVPKSLIATDPYYSSVVLSNLGSLRLRSGYHHLTNWGTCSLFIIIGEKRMTPVFGADGSVTMRETLDLGLTVDERLADGYYYAKTIRLLQHLLQHPELLERPVSEEVNYE